MTKRKNKLSFFLYMVIAFLTFSIHNVEAKEQFTIDSKAAIAVEADTGKILYDKNANKPLPIASLTKLMTVYMTYREIEKGNLSWDTEVSMSDYAVSLANNIEISNPPLYKEKYTVKELVDSSLIVSSNSSAIALAEKIAGSEPKFIDQITKQLEAWGIADSYMVNASGLNNSMLEGHLYPGSGKEEENKLSAKDMAIVACHLIKDYPQVLEITSQPLLYWGTDVLPSSNHLLPGSILGRYGVDGLKTGTTAKAGQTYVGTTVQDGMRVVTVILHANNAEVDPEARFVEASRLFDYSFDHYHLSTLAKKDQTLIKKVPIKKGKTDKLSLTVKEDMTVVSKKNQALPYKITLNQKDLNAPIEKNTAVGRISYLDKDLVGEGYISKAPSQKVYAAKSIEKANLFDLIKKLFNTKN